MSREIKFRYVVKDVSERIHTRIVTIRELDSGAFSLERWGLVQELVARNLYIGLRDCHGTEIYEGDIIRRPNEQIVSVEICNYGAGSTQEQDYFIRGYHYTLEDEVIGNIYENPELLK